MPTQDLCNCHEALRRPTRLYLLVCEYVLSSVDLRDMVPPDLLKAMLRDVPRERHRQVVAQRAELAALVGQVVDKLRVLAVLARQNVLPLEDGGVDRDGAVALEDGLDCTRSTT